MNESDWALMLGDDEHVELAETPVDPLKLGSAAEFCARVSAADAAYDAGSVEESSSLTKRMRERYGL